MKKLNILLAILSLFAGAVLNVNAQGFPRNWHMLDYKNDHVLGIGIEKAYQELLKGKKSNTVLLAIIDVGVDTQHQDIKPVLWCNPNEKPDGLDSDNNGYIDDIYGWNFLGGKTPNENIIADSEEIVRFYFKHKNRFENITSEAQARKKDRELYREWKKCKDILLSRTKEQEDIMKIGNNLDLCDKMNAFFKQKLNKEVYTLPDIESYETENSVIKRYLEIYIEILKKQREGTTNVEYVDWLKSRTDSLKAVLKVPDSLFVSYRNEIVGDDYTDINDCYYGNNNVNGDDPFYGTHAVGIIGAVRNNGIGMDGIADNVKIMVIRAVPNEGDEYDKDIALAIRYAVNNGAKIINMNFGKSFSPERKWVEDAIRYANSKDVLIVKAAGDNKANIDTVERFPTAKYIKGKKSAPNVITVGASGPGTKETGFVAPFSNYGKNSVDVFAPGTDIYSTVPGDKCHLLNGSSVSSAIVAGLAAVLKSYYPSLSAKQIKQVIEESVTKVEEPVLKPTTGMITFPVPMTDICRTGGVVNAYSAIKLAKEIVK